MKHFSLGGLVPVVTISTIVTSLTIASSTLLFPQPANAQDCGTKDGYALPCWRDFLDSGEGDESLPLYPYAKRPNGCSIPGGRPGEYDNFGSLGYDFSFTEVCNQHDRCYYTNGTTPGQCNTAYTERLFEVCKDGISQPLRPQDVLTGGASRAKAIGNCLARAEWMSKAVIAGQFKYHKEAQNKQALYLKKVDEHVAASRPKTETLPTTVTEVTLNGEECYEVNSRQGWQHFTLLRPRKRVTTISGSWSVDTRNYAGVGPGGHSGDDARRLEPYNQYKYAQNFPFGALFVDIPTDGYGYIQVSGSQVLPRQITKTAMRINDADNALGDNAGSLRVCFGN